MASLFAHAALPLVAKTAFRAPAGYDRRVALAAAVCSCLPDADVLAFALETPESSPWAHRGIAHSLFAAAAAALAVGLIGFRALGPGTPAFRRVVLFLFAAGASHGLLDAATASETGVALAWPFYEGRVFFPWKLLPSTQVGVEEYLGFWGVLTIANEVLYAIVPVAIVAVLLRGDVPLRRSAVQAAIWIAVAGGTRLLLPEWFAPRLPRPIRLMGPNDDGDPKDVKSDDLPDGRLLVRWTELEERGLFERPLVPAAQPWSSSFFPSWLGGDSGRWTEPKHRLVWRTLFGFAPPGEAEARRWVEGAIAGDAGAKDRIRTLAPVEKVDLVLGRYDFPATRESLQYSHNGKPRYWSGRCNGVAVASMHHPEPFRVVEVIGESGVRVPFHPNDVKALLAVAYYEASDNRRVGDFCRVIGFDAGATCSMNPAALLLAIANRIGVAKQSFMIDAHPTIAKQYYAVASAFVHVTRPPRPVHEGAIAAIADVSIELTLSSTKLSYAHADVRIDESHYRRVGVVPVVMRWHASIALDEDMTLIGGRWTGDPPDGPDLVITNGDQPALDESGALVAAPRIPWRLVRELARASVDEGSAVPVVDLRQP